MNKTIENAAPGNEGRIVIEDMSGTTILDSIERAEMSCGRLNIVGSIEEIFVPEGGKPTTKKERIVVSISVSTLIKTPHLTIKDQMRCGKCGTANALDRSRTMSFADGWEYTHGEKVSGCAECARIEAEAKAKADAEKKA